MKKLKIEDLKIEDFKFSAFLIHHDTSVTTRYPYKIVFDVQCTKEQWDILKKDKKTFALKIIGRYIDSLGIYSNLIQLVDDDCRKKTLRFELYLSSNIEAYVGGLNLCEFYGTNSLITNKDEIESRHKFVLSFIKAVYQASSTGNEDRYLELKEEGVIKGFPIHSIKNN